MIGGRGRSIACARCDIPLEPGARFCANCGANCGPLYPTAIDAACPYCAALVLPGNACCEYCGAALPPCPYLIITDSGLRLNLWRTERDPLTLGRADALSGVSPDLDLEPYSGPLAGLSRHHARLTWHDEQSWLEDLNSVNWTYLNQQRLLPGQPQALKDGDRLRLGNVLLTYHTG